MGHHNRNNSDQTLLLRKQDLEEDDDQKNFLQAHPVIIALHECQLKSFNTMEIFSE